jgi:putative intracellular protease/amidase
MSATPEWLCPLSWSAPDFTLDSYNLVFLPGGHDKGVRQLLDSPIIHKHLAEYFPKTLKPSTKAVAAICHGVMVLSETKDKEGKSVIHECVTTALPARFEQVAFWGTRVFMGDYYKTYGPCSDNVEEFVRPGSPFPWCCAERLNRFVENWTTPRNNLRAVFLRVPRK